MMPVRRLMIKINAIDIESSLIQEPPLPPSVKNGRYLPKSTIISAAIPPVDADALIKSDPVTMNDISLALQTTRPSSDGNMLKYESWQKEYGSS